MKTDECAFVLEPYRKFKEPTRWPAIRFSFRPDWLLAHLDDPNVSIVDGSWYLPTMTIDGVPRNGADEFAVRHIPGAVFFNIDTITEPGSALPHTLAPPEIFAQKVGALGISDQNTIVVYDGMGLFSAPRVWWNFRVMGASNTVILDGGLPAWQQAKLPVESGSSPLHPKLFNAGFEGQSVADFKTMTNIVSRGSMQIADARPAGRFKGTDAEPRPGTRSGHMPGAKSLQFSDLAERGRLLPADRLKSVFDESGIDLDQPIVTTCGSGVTAAALILALETLGHRDHILYDGSWAEWGGLEDTPIVKNE